MRESELVSRNCENCFEGVAGVTERSALEYMFYHAVHCDHETGWEGEIQKEFQEVL